MSERNYWQRMRSGRMSRRTLLSASARAGVGAAGLALVGCGDDDDDAQQQAAAQAAPAQQAEQQAAQPAAQQAEQQAAQQARAAQQQEAGQQQDDQAAVAQAAAGPGIAGGTVRIPGQDGGLFDPAIAIHGGTYAGVFQIYDWLNYLDEGFVLTEGMAGLPEVVDELNYIYTIKPNVFWHPKPPVDGRQFTAEDAAYGLERFGFDNPEFVFSDRYGLIERFDAIDTLTMHVEAGKVFAPILGAIGEDNALMVARDVVEAFGDAAISSDFEAQIGTGAMMGVSREPEIELVLERHPNYYKPGQPYFDGYRQISIPDAALRVSAFVDGQLDFLSGQWSGSLTDFDAAVAELGEDQVTGVPNPVTYGIAQHIHTEVEPYTDARVRTALHLATDREQLNAITLGGGAIGGPIAAAIAPYGKPADELREIPGYRSGDLRQEDLAEARLLLDASGIDLGNLPSMQVWTSVSDYGQVQQQNFAEIGFDIEIQELSTADALAARQAREGFSIMMLGQQGASDPDLLFNDLHTTGGQNYGNFSDPEMDALFEKGRSVFGVEERKAIYDEAQDKLLSVHNPRIWWHWSLTTVAFRSYCKGFRPTPGPIASNAVLWGMWFDGKPA